MVVFAGVATKSLSGPSRSRPTVLAFEAKLFMADLTSVLRRRGFEVVIISPEEANVARIEQACAQHRPAFALTVNFSPEVAFMCSLEGLPYVSWTVDPLPPSRWEILPNTDLSRCVAFVHDRQVVQRLAHLGLDLRHLPLAASPRRTPAATATEPAYAVSFVGSSLAPEESKLWALLDEAGASSDVTARARAWMSDERTAFDPAIDGQAASLPAWLRDGVEVAPGTLADAVAAALSHRLRVRVVRACLPHGMHVWGDPGWGDLEGAFHGSADHGEELTQIYRKTAVNIDIPRVYQRDIVTMRVFDVLACRAVVVCPHSVELTQLFDVGRHVLTYRSTQELASTVRTLLVDRSLRKTLAEQGHAHVRDHHRIEHRVADMLSTLRERGVVEISDPVDV